MITNPKPMPIEDAIEKAKRLVWRNATTPQKREQLVAEYLYGCAVGEAEPNPKRNLPYHQALIGRGFVRRRLRAMAKEEKQKENFEFLERYRATGPSQSSAAETESRDANLRRLVYDLPENLARVLTLRNFHGMTFEEIGRALNLTGSRGERIEKEGLAMLRRRIRREGLNLRPMPA